HWTTDEWLHSTDARSRATGVDIEFVDLPLPDQKTRIRFTFLWLDENRWEGNDYKIELQARAHLREDQRSVGTVAAVYDRRYSVDSAKNRRSSS
ncbi:MAG: hypothetical protein DMG17_33680, partial [Acidobacteria bacterium]